MNILAIDITQWIIPGILLIMVIGLFVLNFVRSKKVQDSTQSMINSLKVGDKVKTYSGFYGKVVEIRETTLGKIVTLETGTAKKIGYMSIDINAIYSVADDKPVIYDADGNIVNTESVKPEAKTEEVKVDDSTPAKIKVEEPKIEEITAVTPIVEAKPETAKRPVKPATKPTAKKSVEKTETKTEAKPVTKKTTKKETK